MDRGRPSTDARAGTTDAQKGLSLGVARHCVDSPGAAMDREKLACRSSPDADAPVAWPDIELRHLELWSNSDIANQREANDLAPSENDVWKALGSRQ